MVLGWCRVFMHLMNGVGTGYEQVVTNRLRNSVETGLCWDIVRVGNRLGKG